MQKVPRQSDASERPGVDTNRLRTKTCYIGNVQNMTQDWRVVVGSRSHAVMEAAQSSIESLAQVKFPTQTLRPPMTQ